MLTPKQLAYCADGIVDLYSQLNESIVRDIARRIVKVGEITDTADWQVRCLQESGMLYDDILEIVASYSGMSEAAIAQLFHNAAIESMSYDNKIYNAAGLSITVSDAVKQTLTAGYMKTAGDIANLTRTTAVSTQQAFINACTLAELQVSSGAFSYQTAIMNAIQKAGADGVYVIYPSGHRDRIEVAARRNVLTGLSQTTGQISLMNADELGCDLMEITAHAGARPSHAAWQGKIVSRSGRNGYLSLSDIGYGTGDGFKGWNCRHDWYPYIEGISTRAYSDADLAALNEPNIKYNGKLYTEYDAEQRQRAFERAIRNTRSQLAGFNEAILSSKDDILRRQLQEEFDSLSVKLKHQEAVLNDFCDKTGLLKQADRIKTYGFDRSVSRKAFYANKKEIEKYQKYHYNKDGTIVVTDDWKAKKHATIPKKYKPYAVIETMEEKNGKTYINRSIYDENGMFTVQIHTGDHGNAKQHPYGNNGEHHHYYTWEEGKDKPTRITDKLTEKERQENKDIL